MMVLIALLGMMALPDDVRLGVVLVASALGAFLTALPERIRRRKEPRLRAAWQGCLTCFLGGLVMVPALGLGNLKGQLAAGLMQGSVSAWAFGGVAWLTACAAARIKERRRRA